MNRKSIFMTLGISVAVIATVGVGLVLLLRYQPEFYRHAVVAAGPARKQHSSDFRTQLWMLPTDIKNYKVWGARFTDVQMNSFFDEDFLKPGNIERTLFPDGMTAPRVAFDNERIHFGFRYGTGWWSTIISVDLHVWLAANEANVVLMEIERIRAGALPISAQSILDRLSEAARRQDIEVVWYRNEGKPVALLRFGASHQDAGVQMMQFKLQPGMLTISGGDRTKPNRTETEVTATDPPVGN